MTRTKIRRAMENQAPTSWDKIRPIAVLCATAGLAGACKFKADASLGDGVPLAGGSTGTVEVEVENPFSGKVPPQEGLQPGDCIVITFFGPSGEIVGTDTTAVGDSFDIPSGAEEGRIDPCDPPEGPGKKRRNHMNPLVAAGYYGFDTFPLSTTGSRRFRSFAVLAPSHARATLLADAFVATGSSEPLSSRIVLRAFIETDLLASGDVVLRILSAGEPESLELEWNTSHSATLADAVVSDLGQGWFQTAVTIPAALVDLPTPLQSATNEVHYVLRVPGQHDQEATLSVEASL